MGRQHDFLVKPGSRPRLANYDAAFTGGFADERAAREKIDSDCGELARLQDRLMAAETHALLVILQAVDGSGKDGTIKHVAAGRPVIAHVLTVHPECSSSGARYIQIRAQLSRG